MKSNLTGRNGVSHMSKHPFIVSGKSWGFEPKHEHSSVWKACSECSLTPSIPWSAQQTSRKAFHSWIFL